MNPIATDKTLAAIQSVKGNPIAQLYLGCHISFNLKMRTRIEPVKKIFRYALVYM
jgi:hypothetical protein